MAEIIQRSFTSGELAPSLRSRVDLNKYQSGLALCENFITRAQGGVYSRPGTRYVGELGDSTKQGRLLPFSFSTEQTYILVFEHLKMRVIKDGGYILSGGSPYELTTPYTEAQLSRLNITQNADVLTIVHPDHDPKNLNRISETNWTLTTINYASTVTAPVISSVVTVGAGAGSYSKNYTYVVTAVDADGIESLASSSSSKTTPSLSETAGLRITWGAVSGADYYRIYKDPSDLTNVFGWIGDSKTTTFDDFNLAPITSDSHPVDRQPFSGADDKPATVAYYQQRQVFANTNNEPQAVFTTQTGNYNSLRVSSPVKDDDAVTQTIAASQVNEIRHIVSLDSLLLLTSGGEWKATEGQDRVLTPSTIGFRPQSFNGASWVPPVVVNDTVLYVQEKGSRLRDLGYQFSADKFQGDDLSIMSEHLFEGYQITEMTFSDEPYGIVWCVRDDGTLLGLTYKREHQVWGWHRHDFGGDVESVATISEDNRDALYMIVKRTINGSTVRYIERMEIRDVSSAENAFCVDSGLSYDVPVDITGATAADPVVITAVGHGFSDGDEVRITEIKGMTELNGNYYKIQNKTVNTFELTTDGSTTVDGTGFNAYVSGGKVRKTISSVSGLDHLEGENVAVLADGNEVTGLSVSSGSITLPRAASIIHAGLAYTPAMETLDIDSPGELTLKSRTVSVSQVVIEVESSRGGFIGPKLDSNGAGVMREIKPRFDSDGYDPIALRTSKEEINIEPTWSRGGGIRIEQRSPLPLAILSVIPRVDVGG